MKYIKKYEDLKQISPNISKKKITENQLTDLLKSIGKDDDFIKYGNKYGRKDYICDTFDEYTLTHGFCNPLAYYIKDRYLDISVYSAKNDIDGNHLFIKFKNKYYDGSNVYGVDNPADLNFYTDKNITIKLLEK